MNNISVVEALKFGFDKSIKKFFFFITTFIVSALLWSGCFLLSVLVAVPFFIPALKTIKQFLPLLKALPTGGGAAQGAAMGILIQMSQLMQQSRLAFILLVIGVFITVILVWAFTLMISLGLLRIFLDIHDKGHSTISKLFVRPIYIFRAFVVSLLHLVVVGTPLVLISVLVYMFNLKWVAVLLAILVVVWVIYATLKLFYSNYFVIDKGQGVIEAVKSSWRLRGAPVKLLLFGFLLLAIVLAFSIPTYMLNYLHVNFPHMIWFILMVIFHLATRYFFGVIIPMGYVYIYRRL